MNKSRDKVDYINFGKLPPQAVEIESAIIGTMMIDPSCIQKVMQLITTENVFYVDRNVVIFSVIKKLHDEGKIVDFILVTNELRKLGKLEEVGGNYHIMSLTKDVVTSANIEEHIRIILQKYFQRELIRICGLVISDSYSDTSDIFETLQYLKDNFGEINKYIEVTNHRSLNIVIEDFIKSTNKEIENKKSSTTKVVTFLHEYDEVLGELQGGNIYVIAARTSMGKTATEISIILEQSLHFPVGVWNGELTEKRFVRRCISNKANISVQEIQSNPEANMEKIINGLEDLLQHKLEMSNKRGMVIEELCNLIKFWVFTKGVRVVWLDYVQVIQLSEKVQNRIRTKTDQVGYIIDCLNEVSAICDVPIMLLAQLNREALKGDKKPNLGHLRDSGSIEERVYHVSFLHRPEYYGESEFEGKSTENMMQIIVAKNGDGENNKIIELTHDLKYNKIHSRDGLLREYTGIDNSTPF